MLSIDIDIIKDILSRRQAGESYGTIENKTGVSKGTAWKIVNHRRPEKLFLRRDIPVNKIGICQKHGCDEEFIKWAHNRKYCDKHSRSVRKVIQLSKVN